MAGTHEEIVQIRSYTLSVPNPVFGIVVPKQLIKTLKVAKDAQFLFASGTTTVLTMKFLVTVGEKDVDTRVYFLAEGEKTNRQDIGQYMGLMTFTWGTRHVFLLEDSPS